MSRTAIAVPLGLLLIILYVGAAVVLADQVLGLHWALQLPYFLVAGIAWAFPAKWLIVWAATGVDTAGIDGGHGPSGTAH